MPGLFTTLASAANSLGVYSKVLETTSNNINNSSTPGYAKQRMFTQAQAFDPARGLPGGTTAGDLESSREVHAESAVWRNTFAFSSSSQISTELINIEPLFDVTGDGGVPASLNDFFSAVSSWSLAPNDSVARTTVLNRASQAAQQLNSVATGLNTASGDIDDRLHSTVQGINDLSTEIAGINKELRSDYANQKNPALDTRLYNALEKLSEYVDFSVLRDPSGSVTVMLGSQTPLVFDEQQYPIHVDTVSGTAALYDNEGRDITSQVSGGSLNGMFLVKNSILPQYQDQLNQLAVGLSDSVNGVLAAGVDTQGQPGAPLFTYDQADNAAFSIRTTGISASQLAGAAPGAPGGNANVLDLIALSNSAQVNGMGYTQYYSGLAAGVGEALQTAKASAETQGDLVVQARAMRAEVSSVSLDEEAAHLLEYQRCYQATARLITTLNEMTQVTIDMMR